MEKVRDEKFTRKGRQTRLKCLKRSKSRLEIVTLQENYGGTNDIRETIIIAFHHLVCHCDLIIKMYVEIDFLWHHRCNRDVSE